MELQTKNIEYWKNLWEGLIVNFQKKSYGLTLYSPHILIDDIITEIEENKFNNTNNKKFFFSKISEYLKDDFVIKNNFKSDFQILRKIFNSDRKNYILEISCQVKISFKKGLYFDNLLKYLIKLLSFKELSDEFFKEINIVTQNIIVELLKKSYDIKDIKNFVPNIFENYVLDKKNKLITKFPHTIKRENFKCVNNKFNRDNYNKAIIEQIEKLSLKDRINKLSYYFYKKKERASYIFIVEGLKGDSNFEIGDVTFYSTKKKRFIKKISTELESIDFEDLQNKQKENKFLQAKVDVDYLLPNSSLNDALSKIENALDIISCNFKPKAGLEINRSKYIIINKNGRFIHSSLSRDNRDTYMKFYNSIDANEYEKIFKNLNKNIFFGISQLNNKTRLTISNAIHWFRKAENSSKQEDKLLNYWISLETLFNQDKNLIYDIFKDKKKNKFNLIQEIISANQIFVFKYLFGWELFDYYENYYNFLKKSDNKILDNLLIKSNLKVKKGKKIYLKNFIKNLNELKSFEKNLYYIKKIEELYDFYYDLKKSKQLIIKYQEQTKIEILMIYRLRNLIVHNAYYDNTLLPYYNSKIKKYTLYLILKIIKEINKNEMNLSEIFIKIYHRKEKLFIDYENETLNLFKDLPTLKRNNA